MAGEVCGGYGGGRKSAIALLASDERSKISDERLEVVRKNYFSTSSDVEVHDLDIGRWHPEGKSPTFTSSDVKVKNWYGRTKCAENDQFGVGCQNTKLTKFAKPSGRSGHQTVGPQGFER